MILRINGYLVYVGITTRWSRDPWIRQFYMDRPHTGHLWHGHVLTLRSFIVNFARRFSIAPVDLMDILFHCCNRQAFMVLHAQDSFPQINNLLLHLLRDGDLKLIPSPYLRGSVRLHYRTLPFFSNYQQMELLLLHMSRLEMCMLFFIMTHFQRYKHRWVTPLSYIVGSELPYFGTRC